MTINTDTSFVPSTRSSADNVLKKLGKQLSQFRTFWQNRQVSRRGLPLDNHLRRDIGLPDAEPRIDRHLTGWKDPLNVEIRRKW